MGVNYKRRLSLTVGDVRIDYDGEHVPDALVQQAILRVRFDITDTTNQTPRVATIVITNPSNDTAKKIQKATTCELSAGYEDHCGRIFKGEVRQVRWMRESPTDKICIINATTHERAYNYAHVSKTLKAGATGRDVYMACLSAMKPFGVVQGQIPPNLDQLRHPRPVTMFGLARKYLRELAETAQCTWNIRDDNLDVIPKDGARQGSAVVLNSRTGLIGMPEQTNLGIAATVLINPALGINSVVHINEASIQQAQNNFSAGGAPFNQEPYLPSIASDGIYRVVALNHTGDTHNRPWYCQIYCNRRDGALNEAQVQAGFGISPYGDPKLYVGKN